VAAYPFVTRLMDLPAAWQRREIFRSSAGSITFEELRQAMLHVAGWLSGEMGVRPGDRVAICLPRGIAALQAIYGILAAGAAYVPLQFQGPAPRLKRILESVAPRLLVTTPEMAERLAAEAGQPLRFPVRTIAADAGPGALMPAIQGSAPRAAVVEAGPDGLSVIFFTSGSTGEPKGVMWSHRTMTAAAEWFMRCRDLDAETRFIGHVGLHYSASMDIFYPLVAGSSSFLLADREVMFPDQVVRRMAADRTTMFLCSATLLRLMVDSGECERQDMHALRLLDLIGEKVPLPILERAMAALPHTQFANCYGATEAFDITRFAVPRPLPADMTALPIGRPLGNYVFSLRKVDGSEAEGLENGEICVRGPAVAAGYWGDPALTASRRLDGAPDSYRTGDLAHWRADGMIELAGREDHMVKLRGHRFDLGEIEAVLRAHPAVRDAIAFVLPGAVGPEEIRAAVLVASGTDIAGELALLCARNLPSFARPARFLQLDRFPQLSSGKVDRRALGTLAASGKD
jgi:L-proline---[L-prolyl-carrier protein] ligase